MTTAVQDPEEKLRYPHGRFTMPSQVDKADYEDNIATIKTLPSEVQALVKDLSPADLGLTYRPGSWNIKQLVHHLADSHMNMFVRMKQGLTEPGVTGLMYKQALWAETADGLSEDIEMSLLVLTGIHRKMLTLLESLTWEQLNALSYVHPVRGDMTLAQTVALAGWHSRQHLGHIKIALGLL